MFQARWNISYPHSETASITASICLFWDGAEFLLSKQKILVSLFFFFCLLAGLSRCAVLQLSNPKQTVTFILSALFSLGDFCSNSLFIVLSQTTQSSCLKEVRAAFYFLLDPQSWVNCQFAVQLLLLPVFLPITPILLVLFQMCLFKARKRHHLFSYHLIWDQWDGLGLTYNNAAPSRRTKWVHLMLAGMIFTKEILNPKIQHLA